MEDIEEDEEANHVIRIYNTGSLCMTGTHLGNQLMQHNQNEISHTKIVKSTHLGIKIENVSIAELKDCTLTGIMSEKNNGSAMFLQNTEVLMISCEFYFNMAKNGVIFGINSVNITNKNSTFISNYASKLGAVFFLTNSCMLTNDGSVFRNNSAREHAGVVYAVNDITINNRGCSFEDNSAETGNGSVIWMQYNCQLTNRQVVWSKATTGLDEMIGIGSPGFAAVLLDDFVC